MAQVQKSPEGFFIPKEFIADFEHAEVDTSHPSQRCLWEGRVCWALLPGRLAFLLGPDRFGAGLRGFGFSLALHLP
jgi:hypothetical protein